jgi:hypothetical protein
MNFENNKLKQKFKTDFDKVRKFINEFDPCGLLFNGAPIDEYDSLTYQLLSSVYNGKTRIEIKDLILHEIENYFGTPNLETLIEPNKTEFYNDIEKLISKLEQYIEKKPSH